MITAAETCDFINEVVCKPANVKDLFEFANFEVLKYLEQKFLSS